MNVENREDAVLQNIPKVSSVKLFTKMRFMSNDHCEFRMNGADDK